MWVTSKLKVPFAGRPQWPPWRPQVGPWRLNEGLQAIRSTHNDDTDRFQEPEWLDHPKTPAGAHPCSPRSARPTSLR